MPNAIPTPSQVTRTLADAIGILAFPAGAAPLRTTEINPGWDGLRIRGLPDASMLVTKTYCYA